VFTLLAQDHTQYAPFLIYLRRHARVYQTDRIFTIFLSLPTPLRIHVAGPPGVGKTVLGNRLAAALGPKILVKETEDLGQEFVAARSSSYQLFIDSFIARNLFKPLVFLGDNIATVYNVRDHGMFYDLHCAKHYFIDLDPATLLHQKYKRLLNHLSNSAKELPYLFSHNSQYLANVNKAFDDECNLAHTLADAKLLAGAYQSQGYVFASRDQIYNRVLDICQSF
jgi:Cdc6-like AAA superfamily ATPase